MPAEEASSLSILNVPLSSLVFETCGPPQNSIENALSRGPTEYTDTVSGYVAPNSCSAPSFSAFSCPCERPGCVPVSSHSLFSLHLLSALESSSPIGKSMRRRSLVILLPALMHVRTKHHLERFEEQVVRRVIAHRLLGMISEPTGKLLRRAGTREHLMLFHFLLHAIHVKCDSLLFAISSVSSTGNP